MGDDWFHLHHSFVIEKQKDKDLLASQRQRTRQAISLDPSERQKLKEDS
jgi:hypothetical protein